MRISRTTLILIAILMLGAILRVAYLSEIVKHRDFAKPAIDALYHDYWARGIVTGNWTPPPPLDDPQIPTTPYFRSPGYTYFMAGVYFLTGGSYLGLRVVQMIIGLLSCLIAFFLGARFLSPRAGLLSAALMSVYWVFIYFEGELLEPVLLVALGLWLLHDLARWTERVSFRHAILSGVIVGLFALVRPNVLLFAPAVVFWAYWLGRRRKNVRGFVYASLGLALGSIVTISPAAVRNYLVSGDFVPISSNTGINLYIGNNELANGQCVGFVPGLGNFETCFDYPQIVKNIEKETGRKLKHSEVSSYFTRKAVEYARAKPGRVLALTWRKALMFWAPVEIGHNKEDELERANSGVLRYLRLDFPVVLALSLVGLTMLVLETRRRGAMREIGETERHYEVSILILLFVAAYFISYVPFFAAGRYRVPIVPCLVFFGAYALDYMIALITARRAKAALWWTLALLAAYGISRLNPTGYKPDAAKWHFDRAVDLSLAGDPRRAIVEYSKALELRPLFPQAHCNLGFALMEQGKIDEAIGHFEKALEIDPKEPLAHYCMGLALSRQNKTDAAIKEFRRSLELQPYDASAHYELGVALASKDRIAEAKSHFVEALRANPSFAPAYTSLGVFAEEEGEIEAAVKYFDRSVALEPSAELHYRLGSMLARLRRFDGAMEHYRGAIEIKPDYAAAHHGLAVILSSKGQFEEAIKHYSEAVKFAPRYAQAHLDYAAALYFSGDFARAWEQLAAARKYGAKVDPEFVKALSAEMPEPK